MAKQIKRVFLEEVSVTRVTRVRVYADCRMCGACKGDTHRASCLAGQFGNRLIYSGSDKAFKHNVATEIKAGRRRDVALAIAYRVQRQLKRRTRRAR